MAGGRVEVAGCAGAGEAWVEEESQARRLQAGRQKAETSNVQPRCPAAMQHVLPPAVPSHIAGLARTQQAPTANPLITAINTQCC